MKQRKKVNRKKQARVEIVVNPASLSVDSIADFTWRIRTAMYHAIKSGDRYRKFSALLEMY